jgi:hypothetical protein
MQQVGDLDYPFYVGGTPQEGVLDPVADDPSVDLMLQPAPARGRRLTFAARRPARLLPEEPSSMDVVRVFTSGAVRTMAKEYVRDLGVSIAKVLERRDIAGTGHLRAFGRWCRGTHRDQEVSAEAARSALKRLVDKAIAVHYPDDPVSPDGEVLAQEPQMRRHCLVDVADKDLLEEAGALTKIAWKVEKNPRENPLHPFCRIMRAFHGHLMVRRATAESDDDTIVDIGSAFGMIRHWKNQRWHVFGLCPGDRFNPNPRQPACKCRMQDFRKVGRGCDKCRRINKYSVGIMTHVAYYLPANDIIAFIVQHNMKAVYSVHHRFYGTGGTFGPSKGAVEARWERQEDGMIVFEAGEEAYPPHGDMSWLTREQMIVVNGELWYLECALIHSDRIAELVKFTVSRDKPKPLKKRIRSLEVLIWPDEYRVAPDKSYLEHKKSGVLIRAEDLDEFIPKYLGRRRDNHLDSMVVNRFRALDRSSAYIIQLTQAIHVGGLLEWTRMLQERREKHGDLIGNYHTLYEGGSLEGGWCGGRSYLQKAAAGSAIVATLAVAAGAVHSGAWGVALISFAPVVLAAVAVGVLHAAAVYAVRRVCRGVKDSMSARSARLRELEG